MVIHASGVRNSLFVTNERVAAQDAEKANKNSKTLFAGARNNPVDTIAMKRERAQKQALKVVGDVFEGEKKLDQDMQAMLDKTDELRRQRIADKESIQQMEAERGTLMELYGVSEDSEEYENLELLRKEKESQNPSLGIELTEEEEARLAQIHEAGLTGFQEEMLSLDDGIKEYEDKVTASEKSIEATQQGWADMKLERLKKDPMAKASEQAEEIMMQANKDIIGELQKEAMNHVEEKLQEVVEEAKEKAEKEKEEEEKLEERKEKKEEIEEAIEKAAENNASSEVSAEPKASETVSRDDMDTMVAYNSEEKDPNKELKKIVEELDLIMEDLKGIEVDTNI